MASAMLMIYEFNAFEFENNEKRHANKRVNTE